MLLPQSESNPDQEGCKYQAHIWEAGQERCLGVFRSAHEAALAYARALGPERCAQAAAEASKEADTPMSQAAAPRPAGCSTIGLTNIESTVTSTAAEEGLSLASRNAQEEGLSLVPSSLTGTGYEGVVLQGCM